MLLRWAASLVLCFAVATVCLGAGGESPSPSQAAVRHILTSDGVDLYVTVKGQGTPCLYIHGGPGSGSYWLEKFSGEMLERHFRMIYLDQRGTARSTSPKDGDYSLDRMVKDFEEVRTALGIKQWLTLGHSLGGIMQIGYAQRHPEVIKGMLMINCTLDLEDSSRSSWIPKACEFLGLTDTEEYTDPDGPLVASIVELGGKLREKGLFWKLGYASEESEKLMNASFGEIPNWDHDQETAILAAPGYRDDFRKLTPTVKMPVLFFYGRTDWMVGPEHYRGVHFPQMLLWGSDVGHMPFLENKADLEKAVAAYQHKYGL